jgi:hypothetical protein
MITNNIEILGITLQSKIPIRLGIKQKKTVPDIPEQSRISLAFYSNRLGTFPQAMDIAI